jgi:hypothetical protein
VFSSSRSENSCIKKPKLYSVFGVYKLATNHTSGGLVVVAFGLFG